MSAHIYRPIDGRLKFRTPYMPGNRRWLLDIGIRPERDRDTGLWMVSRSRLFELANAAADRFGRCEVVMDHRTAEQCHEKCQGAKGDDCTCSCLGKSHGGGRALAGWFELGGGVLISDDVIQASWVVEARR